MSPQSTGAWAGMFLIAPTWMLWEPHFSFCSQMQLS